MCTGMYEERSKRDWLVCEMWGRKRMQRGTGGNKMNLFGGEKTWYRGNFLENMMVNIVKAS